jgi:hypothetical protein
MEQKDLDKFAELLERAGYSGALRLIKENLIPIAEKQHISLLAAAREYADCDEEQDASRYELFEALSEIKCKFLPPSIFKPL